MSLSFSGRIEGDYQYLDCTCKYIRGNVFEHHCSGVDEEQYCSHAEYCQNTNPPSDITAQTARYPRRPIVFGILRTLNVRIVLSASQAKNPVHRSALLRTVPASDHSIAGKRR
jgi:hypothetical protein